MNRPSVAICVIAKNEENNVRQWHESIKGLFDEVHFVDTGSTDNTVSIAKTLGCTVHHFDWINDFSAARNFAFSKAKSDYIFWNDLDDVIENREAFIRWRDTAMGLADYWLANYLYTSDANGKPVCTFARERVFRNHCGFKWTYQIHEGVLPKNDVGNVRIQFATTWAIRHMRTEEDLKKDRTRNLSIFEDIKKTQKLDGRLLHYYGKELFEAGKPLEAINVLGDALSKPDLELHDRLLGMQYLCYAYMQCNQFAKAVDMAMAGIQLVPNRAEFYIIVGDCQIKVGKPVDAIPFFEAARNCQMTLPTNCGGALFNHEESYSTYPLNQLARLYVNLGQIDAGEERAKVSAEKYKNPEGAGLLNQIDLFRKTVTGYKTATPCDDIVFTTPPQTPYEFDPLVAKTRSMGGSETALLQMAHWLKRLAPERTVKVFNMRQSALTVDGVEYIPVNQVHHYFKDHKPYFHVAWRHNNKLTDAPTFVWSHDLMTPGVESTENYNKVLCLTPFHKRYMSATQGVPEDKIFLTRNGIIPERFKDGPWDKDPFRFVYSSSPDRGMDRCMKVLDKVREEFPKVTLHVHYGIEHLPQYGHTELMQKLRRMLDERKSWVTYHGATQQDALMKSFKQSSFNVQPSDWIETSCISVMELIGCGVYPIFRGIGGVVDTMQPFTDQGMASIVYSECITEADYQRYIDATIEAIKEERYKRVKMNPDELSWELVAKQWLEEFPKCF